MEIKSKHISSILLNYNSNEDLKNSVPDLLNQNKESHTVIIVDNNSSTESVNQLKQWQSLNFPNALNGTVSEVDEQLKNGEYSKIIFVYNNKNAGYSAGNNIGIRIADKLNSEAVLIVNPDMRIHDDNYISKLCDEAEKDDKVAIAASRIIGVDGENQSPMAADDFWREFLWPKQLFPKIFKQPEFIVKIDSIDPVYVTKVMGCCMLLKMDFLKEIGLMDETTFLYSEEAILSSQVSSLGKKIKFIPSLVANHMHYKKNKENSSKRMLLMIKSRLFYIKTFSNYSYWERNLLFISYRFLKFAHFIKSKIG